MTALPKPYIIYRMVNTMADKKRFEIVGKEIVIRFPIVPTISGTGKSMTLATTRGKEMFVHDGKEVLVNLNVYMPIDQWTAQSK